MKNDLISRSALTERLIFKRDYNNSLYQKSTYPGLESAIAQVKKAPAVAAVEVVRCRDCKYMEIEPSGRYCHVWGFFNGAGDDGFCNYGEKRGGERKDNG